MPRSPRRPVTVETIGAALAELAGRLDELNKQRGTILRELRTAVEEGQKLLVGLGSDGAPRRKGGRPKGYKMSDETRAKLRAAWRRRKAGPGKN